jgi:hypothetical protein
MKKFNLQFSFLGVLFLLACDSASNGTATTLAGKTIDVNKGIKLFIFINTECPISQKYQGKFSQTIKTNAYWVFPGNQALEDIKEFIQYDSLKLEKCIADVDYQLCNKVGASVTPEAIVIQDDVVQYTGKIDNRFKNLGSNESEPDTNFVENALTSLRNHEPIQIKKNQAVGCFIEPH